MRLPMILLQFASIVLLVLAWAPRMGRPYGLKAGKRAPLPGQLT
jgi:hypothetical protein